MDLFLTVVNPTTGSSVDVHAAGPDSFSAGPLLASLRQAVGAAAEAPLSVGSRYLASTCSLVDCGLTEGAVVRVGTPTRLPAADLELVVSSGQQAGQRLRLVPGSATVGRGADCQLRLTEPSVSRHHLRVTTTATGSAITDLGSANGTSIDGLPLVSERAADLTLGSTLRLGDCDLWVDAAIGDDAAINRGGIHRAPRLDQPPAVAEVEFPVAPVRVVATRLPLLAALAPLTAGLLLSVVLGQWQFLAFTALSPVMIVGQAVSDRLAARRTNRGAEREHALLVSQAEAALDRALTLERDQAEADTPDLGRITSAAFHGRPPLWQRGPTDSDAVVLRLGRGSAPSRVRTINHPQPTATDVPICLDLAKTGVVGITGPADLTAGLTRSLLIQAATVIGPTDLTIAVLAPGRARDWGWARWLPHLGAQGHGGANLGFDPEQVADRLAELGVAGSSEPALTLVVVDGRAALLSSAVSALRSGPEGSDARQHTAIICRADNPTELPSQCRAVIEIGNTETIRYDLLSADLAETTARALAGHAAPNGASSYDSLRAVQWSELNALDLSNRDTAAGSLVRSWSSEPTTTVSLGRGVDGTVSVDLASDGPHVLIAGTTGSGKSELLQNLIASLAAGSPPDQLSFLLIDHKGGATLAPCARLPHAVGLVTDLDSASTQRALVCLGAELKRREVAFAAARVTDLTAYRAVQQEPSIARLVIVIDEFAALAEDQPDFVGGLVGIAQRGRSLGVHLVLATQRPDGVVSADIRANTRLRICLAVAREQESRDVLDSPAAAHISHRVPGRGYVRIGAAEPRLFQAARIAGVRSAGPVVTVTRSPTSSLGDPASPVAAQADESDLDILVDAAREANDQLGCLPSPAPWLPPLPATLELSDPSLAAGNSDAAWGLVDLPRRGEQPPLVVPIDAGGTTVIAGCSRSGRTTAALAFATSMAAARSPAQLQLWAIDSGVGLATLNELPHCGAVIGAQDGERIGALLDYLERETTARRRRRQPAGPTMLLLVDSWDGLAATDALSSDTEVTDRLTRLAANAASTGLHLVIAGDRGVLSGRLGAAASERIVLRLADRSDYLLIGLSCRDIPRRLEPGRGVRASDHSLVQIAVPDQTTTARAMAWPMPEDAIRTFAALPEHLDLIRLATPKTQGRIVVGLDSEQSVVLLTRAEIDGLLVVAGPTRSGRSAALLLVATQLRGRRTAVSCADHSPLAALPNTIRLPHDDQDHAVAILEALLASCDAPPPDVIVDDLDQLPDGSLRTRLEDLINARSSNSGIVALSTTTDAATAAFRGPLVAARRARVAVMLGRPAPHAGDLFGVTLPRTSRDLNPPGRAWLLRDGRARRVQLAIADPTQPRTECELASLGARSRE